MAQITAVALAGVVLGSRVQKFARFILPKDPFTAAVVALVIADCVLGITPLDTGLWGSFLVGYAVGYLVVGLTAYTMVFSWDLGAGKKHWSMKPIVFYEIDGKMYLQPQESAALLKRAFLGIQHEVESNVPLDDDWTCDCKFPLFAPFRKDVLFVESITEGRRLSDVRGKERMVPVTKIRVAYGSAATTAQLILDARYLEQMQDQNVRILDRLHRVESEQGTKLMEMALQITRDMECQSPENRMLEIVRGRYAAEKEEKVSPRPVSGKKEDKNDADESENAQASARSP